LTCSHLCYVLNDQYKSSTSLPSVYAAGRLQSLSMKTRRRTRTHPEYVKPTWTRRAFFRGMSVFGRRRRRRHGSRHDTDFRGNAASGAGREVGDTAAWRPQDCTPCRPHTTIKLCHRPQRRPENSRQRQMPRHDAVSARLCIHLARLFVGGGRRLNLQPV